MLKPKVTIKQDWVPVPNPVKEPRQTKIVKNTPEQKLHWESQTPGTLQLYAIQVQLSYILYNIIIS